MQIILYCFVALAVVVIFFAIVYLLVEFIAQIGQPKKKRIPYFYQFQKDMLDELVAKSGGRLRFFDWVAFRSFPIFVLLVVYTTACFGLGFLIDPIEARTGFLRHAEAMLYSQQINSTHILAEIDRLLISQNRRIDEIEKESGYYKARFEALARLYCSKVANKHRDECK